MKPTKQQMAAQRFAARTERLERQRKMATRHANHARRLAKAQAERAEQMESLAQAQAAWDADHPRKADLEAEAELREAAEDLGIEIEHYDEADLVNTYLR